MKYNYHGSLRNVTHAFIINGVEYKAAGHNARTAKKAAKKAAGRVLMAGAPLCRIKWTVGYRSGYFGDLSPIWSVNVWCDHVK